MSLPPATAQTCNAHAGQGRTLPVCIHIGLTKTATTLLQEHLFPHHSQVKYLGKLVRNGIHNKFRCPDAANLVAQLLEDHAWQPDLERCRQQAVCAVRGSVGQRVVVLSQEGWGNGSSELHAARARNLRAVFGSCRMLITLRHPLKRVESEYFQHLKWAHLAKSGWNHYKQARLFTIEQYLARGWEVDRAFSSLHYASTIRTYAEILGKEAVGVFLFEQLLREPQQFVADLCRFLDIDAMEAWNLCQAKRANDRWTGEQLERLRRIERSTWRQWLFRISTQRQRCRMLGLVTKNQPQRPGPKAQAEIPLAWQQRIIERTAPGNRWLQEHWGLPMEAYGYPL